MKRYYLSVSCSDALINVGERFCMVNQRRKFWFDKTVAKQLNIDEAERLCDNLNLIDDANQYDGNNGNGYQPLKEGSRLRKGSNPAPPDNPRPTAPPPQTQPDKDSNINKVGIDKHWLKVQVAGVRTVFCDSRSPERVLQERLESLFKSKEIPPEVIGLCQLYACHWLDGLAASVESFASKTVDAEYLRAHADRHTKLAADMFVTITESK